MKKQLVIYLCFSFVFIYASADFFNFFHQSQKLYLRNQIVKQNELAHTLEVAKLFLIDGNFEAVTEYFQKEKNYSNPSFHFIFENNSPLISSDIRYSNTAASFLEDPVDFKKENSLLILKIKTGPYTVVTGYHLDYSTYLKEQITLRFSELTKNVILMLISLLGFIFSFFLINTKLQDPSHSSPISTGKQQNLIISKKNKFIDANTLPALKFETDTNTLAPFSFPATVVRLQINSILNWHKESKTDKIIEYRNDLLKKVLTLVSRHQGIFSQFTGDEFIFYFKGSQQISNMRAWCCLRDCLDLCVENNSEENPLYFKSSICFGQLTYANEVYHLNNIGLPFIITEKLLHADNTEAKNTIVCAKDDDLEDFIGFKKIDERDFVLTGINESILITSYEPLRLTKETLELNSIWINRAKSDSSIALTIEELKTIQDPTLADALVLSLTKHHFIQNCKNLNKLTFELIQEWQNKCTQDNAWGLPLTRFISLLERSFIENTEKQTFVDLCAQNLLLPDTRLQANSIEIISAMLPQQSFDFSKHSFSHNRPLANALIADAKSGLKDTVFDKLEALLKDNRIMYQASGLYAARQIFLYYQETDPTVIQSSKALNKVMQFALKTKYTSNAMTQQELLKKAYESHKIG